MLHKLNRIFVIHLVQEKLIEFEKLVTLNILYLLGAANVRHLRDSVWEFEVDEGGHAIQDAFGLDVLCLVDGLLVLGRCFC